jgi:hypothetical protein
MDGGNGAMLVIISNRADGKDTIIDALKLRHHDPDYHYVITCTLGRCTVRSTASTTCSSTRDLRRAAGGRGALEANEVHGNGTGRPAGRSARHAGRTSSRTTSRAPVVKEKVPGALVPHPAVA